MAPPDFMSYVLQDFPKCFQWLPLTTGSSIQHGYDMREQNQPSSTGVDWLNFTRELTRCDPTLRTLSVFYKEVLLKLPPSTLATSTAAKRSDAELEKECRNVRVAWTFEIGPRSYGCSTWWRGPKDLQSYVMKFSGLNRSQMFEVRRTTPIAQSQSDSASQNRTK
jgi:hypothetical protein